MMELAELRQRAAAGEIEASTLLGMRALTGAAPGVSIEQGARLLTDAAERGGGSAAHLMAVLAAAGSTRAQSWPDALDYLQRSAEAGWDYAQRELALLAGQPDARADWAALRRAVDIDAWLAPPPRQSLCEQPRIRAVAGFLSPSACDWLVQRAAPRLAAARVFAAGGQGALYHGRSNREADLGLLETDLVVLFTQARIGVLTQLPLNVMEVPRVLHYTAGQQFQPHYDFIDPEVPGFAAEIARAGQRIVTFLVYLSDEYEGGETEFAEAGIRHKGRKGDALYFANVDAAGAPERRTRHAGLPVTRGEKWVYSQWIRNRPPAPA